MIRSMTGYGGAERITKRYHIKVEIKSLNGKFLELNLRCPKSLGEKEPALRKHLSKKLVRGSVLCILTMENIDSVGENVKLNDKLARHYFHLMKSLADELNTNDQDILRTVLTMPDVLRAEDGSIDDEDWSDILATVNEAFDKFDAYRIDEGKELAGLLSEHNAKIMSLLNDVETYESDRKQSVKNKLLAGLEDFAQDNKVDQNRFEQELIYYLEKMDVAEEKNRLQAHCQLFAKEVTEASNGKKLGFISQEIGREINTLGSKASYAPMQEVVIQMKEELEKIKEQSLNVL